MASQLLIHESQTTDGQRASSHNDFIAKNRIALKEAKETRFRLRVCRRCDFLDTSFDPLVQESDELVRILGKIVSNALRNRRHQRRRSGDKDSSNER